MKFFAIVVFFLVAASCCGLAQNSQPAVVDEVTTTPTTATVLPDAPAPSSQLIFWSRDGAYIPWYFYTGQLFTADIRYGMDEDKTLTACLGKSFGPAKFSINPEFCGDIGKHMGYGPEIWFLSDTSRVSEMSYCQYVKALNDTSYAYCWFESEYKFSSHFNFGGALETDHGGGSGEVNLGPSFKFFSKGLEFDFQPLAGKGGFSPQGGIIKAFNWKHARS